MTPAIAQQSPPSSSFWATRLLAAAVAALVLPGCGDLEPCHDIKKGDRIEITLLRLHPQIHGPDEESACLENVGLALGQRLVATVKNLSGNDTCLSGMANIQHPGDWVWKLRYDTGEGGHLLEGAYDVSNGVCSASLGLAVDATGLPTPPLRPGGFAPGGVFISYPGARDADCLASPCTGALAAHIEKISR